MRSRSDETGQAGVTRADVEILIQKHEYLNRRLREILAELESSIVSLDQRVAACYDGELSDLIERSGVGSLSRNLSEEAMRLAKGVGSISALAEMDDDAYRRLGGKAHVVFDVRLEACRVLERARGSFEVELVRGRSESLDWMMAALLRMRASRRQVSQCRALLDFYDNIERAAADLDRGTQKLRWEYASDEQRQVIRGAFDYLCSTYGGQYGDRVRSTICVAAAISQLSPDEAWGDFARRPEETYKVLDACSRGRFFGGPRAPSSSRRPFSTRQVESALNARNAIARDLRRSATDADSPDLREAVKFGAYGLVKRELTEHLRAIPVEELNRGGKGYHVAALRRAGYDNLAAVAAATVYNLRALRGVSANAARMIKHDCENYASHIETSIRIRLSVDNRNEESTSLVTRMHSLLLAREVKARCEEHLQQDRETYAVEARVLELGGYDELSWLVWGDLRERKVTAYETLRSGAEDEFPAWRADGVDAMRAALEPNPDAAWSAFEASPFEYYNLLEELVPELIGGDGTYGLPEELAREIEDQDFFPKGLLCSLRRYQEWGVKYVLHQERVLLGDEMGLGKTVQAIAAMVSLRNTGETHFMVICPASVLVNWCREVADKSRLRVTRMHGRDALAALRAWTRSGGVVVTTYETITRLTLPQGVSLGMLVVDEAHYVKNPEARRSKRVRALAESTARVLFMTGTALENRVGEMVELMRVLQPEVAAKAVAMASISSAPAFRDIVAPVYYRRRREDVLAEMPDLVESKVWCSLEGEELEAYEREILRRNFMGSRRVSWNVGDISTASSKAERMLEIIEDAEDDGRKVLVFSYFRDTIEKICDMLGGKAVGPINGSVSPRKRQEIIDGFESAPSGSALVAQIQSGGTGLNIQSASVVIICEPQLKPSIESQAISRAYRMGQTRNVLVYRLLCENTVDERITSILAEKQRAFDAFADKSVAALDSIALDDATQKDIIEQELERIMAKNAVVDD